MPLQANQNYDPDVTIFLSFKEAMGGIFPDTVLHCPVVILQGSVQGL